MSERERERRVHRALARGAEEKCDCGTGRGIGRAIALLCAEEGAHVAIMARTKAELDAVAVEAKEKFDKNMVVVTADVTSVCARVCVRSRAHSHMCACMLHLCIAWLCTHTHAHTHTHTHTHTQTHTNTHKHTHTHTQEADVKAAVIAASQALGGDIEILVNNAGGGSAKAPVHEQDVASFRKLLDHVHMNIYENYC